MSWGGTCFFCYFQLADIPLTLRNHISTDSSSPSETGKNVLKLSTKLLGTEEAWLWVGSAYSPLDNDDARVKETRGLMEKYYPYVPYGMWVGNKEGEKMVALKNTEDFYVVDLSDWPVGSYRMNLHTHAGEASLYGLKLNPEDRSVKVECLLSGTRKIEISANVRHRFVTDYFLIRLVAGLY